MKGYTGLAGDDDRSTKGMLAELILQYMGPLHSALRGKEPRGYQKPVALVMP